jgi:hypothetical protein
MAARAMRIAETQAPPPLRTKTTAVGSTMEGRREGQSRRPPWGLTASGGRRKLELVTMVIGGPMGVLSCRPSPSLRRSFADERSASSD